LALREMLRLFFVPGFLFCRTRHEAVAALRNSSGNLAIFAAIRRAPICEALPYRFQNALLVAQTTS
jgi:hypothetical protein